MYIYIYSYTFTYIYIYMYIYIYYIKDFVYGCRSFHLALKGHAPKDAMAIHCADRHLSICRIWIKQHSITCIFASSSGAAK